MFKLVLSVIVVVGSWMGVASAQTKIEQAPIKPTSAADAQKMYVDYCAVCHGKAGKGDGPAATALKKVPADLTRISARNGGTFPEVKVTRYIQGLDEVSAHGTRDMPIWGELFKGLNENTAQIRATALTTYVKSLQQ